MFFKAIETRSKEQEKANREKKGTTVKDRGFKKTVVTEKVQTEPDNEPIKYKEDKTKDVVDDSYSAETGNKTPEFDEKEKEKSKKMKKKKNKKSEIDVPKDTKISPAVNDTSQEKSKKSKKRKLTEGEYIPSKQNDNQGDNDLEMDESKSKRKRKKKLKTKNSDKAESGPTKIKVTDESIKKLGRKQTGVVKVVKIKRQTERLSNGATKNSKKSAKMKKMKMDDKNSFENLLQSNGDGGDGNEFGSGVSNW